MKFKDLKFKKHPFGEGKRAVIYFKNGYGASIVTGAPWFYANEQAPYELAVLTKNGLIYKTPITDDVLGYLSEKDVEEVLDKIANLPKVQSKEEV